MRVLFATSFSGPNFAKALYTLERWALAAESIQIYEAVFGIETLDRLSGSMRGAPDLRVQEAIAAMRSLVPRLGVWDARITEAVNDFETLRVDLLE
jgi:hypothetical protein